MDGHRRQHGGTHDGYRRGGKTGSNGSLKRQKAAMVYRRVESAPTDDAHVPEKAERDDERPKSNARVAAPTAGTEPDKPAFRSSLQMSLATDNVDPGGRGGGGSSRHAEGERGGRRASPSRRGGRHRSRSPRKPHANAINTSDHPAGRQVTLSTAAAGGRGRGSGSGGRAAPPSPRPSPTRRVVRAESVGSNASSVASQREDPPPPAPTRLLSTSLSRSISTHDVRSASGPPRTGSRDRRGHGPTVTARNEPEMTSRRVEMSRTRAAESPAPAPRLLNSSLSRRESVESNSSDRPAAARGRWDTKAHDSEPVGKHPERRDNDRGLGRLGRLERSLSDHTSSANAPAKGTQDVRHAEPSTTLSSLAAATSKSGSDTRPGAGVSTRANVPSWKPTSLQSALSSPPKTTPPEGTSPAPVATSTLAAATSASPPKAEPRRLVDRLRDEGRMTAPTSNRNDWSSKPSASSSRSDWPPKSSAGGLRRMGSSSGVGLQRVDSFGSSQSEEKLKRSREHFAKIENDARQKEAARRTTPIVSSLQSSLSSSLSTTPDRSLGRSSLLESLAASRVAAEGTRVPISKTTYTVDTLRSLRSQAVTSKPIDRSMIVDQHIEFRPQGQVPDLRSARRVEASSKRGSKRLDRGRSRAAPPPSKKDRQRSGRKGYQPPPPPLFDGPVEPIKHSENRWVRKTESDHLAATLSYVKGVLNKLTREKFVKLTAELCKIEMTSLELLRSIVSVIMDKALEEPSFADVYADLCKEFHTRSMSNVWRFLRAAQHVKTTKVFQWTVVDCDDKTGFRGPCESVEACFDGATAPDKTDVTAEDVDIASAKVFVNDEWRLVVVEKAPRVFFFKAKRLSELGEDEPLIGEFSSEDMAIQAGAKHTSFKRLLVTRCQVEFEKWTNRDQRDDEGDSTDEAQARKREMAARREKQLMLGNIRFIGELFKTDLLNQIVVQNCLYHLLGLVAEKTEGDGAEVMASIVRLPDEEDAEALCKLLATVGKKFDKPKTQNIMKIIISRMVELSEDKALPSRSRFLIKDVLEMRDHLWEPRRKELQQKTLEEVRREAKQLQQQGKNAQHDNLNQRRLKSQVSSAQLAKQSSNLLVRKDTVDESEEKTSSETSPTASAIDPARLESRIKNIIQEFVSIGDFDEALTCVRELPKSVHDKFAEQVTNRVLEGNDSERAVVVDLLVKLYERGAVNAASIQVALLSVLEFLEDVYIDIPYAHRYSAVLLGRLIAAGCFGLSWMVSNILSPLVDCGLAGSVFAEALPVIESDSDRSTVVRMLADEEVSIADVLPGKGRHRDPEQISEFIEKHSLQRYFGGDCAEDDDDDDDGNDDDEHDEMDPEVETKLKGTVDEYLTIKDSGEVIACVNELEAAAGGLQWRHFVTVCLTTSLDSKLQVRLDIAGLLFQLFEQENIEKDDFEEAFELVLADYEDLRVDVPSLDDNLAQLWGPLFHKEALSIEWLLEVTERLMANGGAARILAALLGYCEATYGLEALEGMWRKQGDDPNKWWVAFSPPGAVDAKLQEWQQKLSA